MHLTYRILALISFCITVESLILQDKKAEIMGHLRSSTFKPVSSHEGIEEANNVCLSITDPCSSSHLQASDGSAMEFMAKKLNLQPMKNDGKEKVLQTGLLVTRAKKASVSESMLPLFDFVDDVAKKLNEKKEDLFSAMVMPQTPNGMQFKKSQFDADVLDAFGMKEKALFCEDIKKFSGKQVCFNRLLRYREKKKSGPTPKHISQKAAEALRLHASVKESTSQGRNAVLVMRKDHMGWMNFVEVEQKLRALLKEQCWNLAVVAPADAPAQQAQKNLQNADLVLANHGAHNEHMIWMPRKAGFIEDKNCKCSTYGYQELAKQENLYYLSTHGTDGSPTECQLQDRGIGICAADSPRVVDFQEEIAPKVAQMIELLEKDRTDRSKSCV